MNRSTVNAGKYAELLYLIVAIVATHIDWFIDKFSLRDRRISFGSMVACENPDCAIEWFHFECVGLKVEV